MIVIEALQVLAYPFGFGIIMTFWMETGMDDLRNRLKYHVGVEMILKYRPYWEFPHELG